MKCKGVSHSPGLFCVLAQCVGSLLWFIRCQCWKFCWRLVEPLLISGCSPERKLSEKGSFVVFSVAEVSQVDDYFVQRYFCCFNIRIQFQRSQDTIYIDKKRMQSFANLTNLHFIHSRTQETRKCLSWENSFWIWFQKLMSTKSGQGHVYIWTSGTWWDQLLDLWESPVLLDSSPSKSCCCNSCIMWSTIVLLKYVSLVLKKPWSRWEYILI